MSGFTTMRTSLQVLTLWLAGLGLALGQANSIDQFAVTTQNTNIIVTVTTSAPLQGLPPSFSVSSPAVIAVDFPNTVNGLGRSSESIAQGDLKSMDLVQAAGRTRLVLNLQRPAVHAMKLKGNKLLITLSPSATAAGGTNVEHFAASSANVTHSIRNIDFERGGSGQGRVLVDLSDSSTGIDVRRRGSDVVVLFLNTSVPDRLQRRLNVTDFATPVQTISTYQQGKNVRMVIAPKGQWKQTAYQIENRFVVAVKAAPRESEAAALQQGKYSGQKLSLNFQSVPVRQVLNVIADFTNLNIIVSPSVSGNITLRLKDVPWDQALSIILQTRGLGMQRNGNVIWIAPQDEIATREKLLLEQRHQIANLEPTETEAFQLNYQKAADVQKLLTNPQQRMLSKRGSAVVDSRTNMLFVRDTPSRLAEIRKLIAKIDVPVRQVMIAARIVEADDTFQRNLGVRLGYQETAGGVHNGFLGGGQGITFGGNLNSTGYGAGQVAASGATGTAPLFPTDSLLTNLPAAGINSFNAGQFSFVLFNAGLTRFLDLELSALEADGKGKIISSPRVLTADQSQAVIEQGTEIPYQMATSSGATAVRFEKAALSLKVKPQITPNGDVIMTLNVSNDSAGVTTPTGVQINTKHVQTEVLVQNGGTVVIGGIYQQESQDNTTKIPFLGNLPYVGFLFKNDSINTSKTELLVFITPRIVNQRLNLD